jgi:hypothetical protein
MTEGQPAFGAREVFSGAKAERRLHTFNWQIDFLVALRPRAGLVALRQRFVYRCHGVTGLPRTGKSEQ